MPAIKDADDQAAPASGEAGAADRRDAATITVLAVALTLGTGATDVASFTRLGDVFTSVMTGNLVLLGLAIGRLSGSLATHAVVAFAGYLAGVAAGTRLVPADQDHEARWHETVPAALLVELVLLAGFTVGWELTGAAPHGAAQLVLLALAATAMGTQSAAARGFGAWVSTTYMTGTVTSVVATLVTARRLAGVRWREASPLVGLAAGAAIGGLLIANAAAGLPAVPLIALVLVIGAARARERGARPSR